MSAGLVTLDDIRAAAGRVRPYVRRTPILATAGGLTLKCENLQPGGAFKIRGACNMLAQLSPAARAAGVITYSSGNHGQAVALAAARLGARAVVVMPETAPQVKVDGVRRWGGDVIMAGTTLFHRQARAEQEAASRGLSMVPPFDHAWIVAGAGTLGLELLEDCAHLTTVYVPVGGGGLLSGVAAALKQMRPSVRVIGVEPDGAASMLASRAAGQPVTLAATASIADGLLAGRPGDLTFAHMRAYVDDLVTVPDADIEAAVRWVFAEARLVVEPSGAVSVAAARRDGAGKGALAILSGGNVDAAAFARYIV